MGKILPCFWGRDSKAVLGLPAVDDCFELDTMDDFISLQRLTISSPTKHLFTAQAQSWAH